MKIAYIFALLIWLVSVLALPEIAATHEEAEPGAPHLPSYSWKGWRPASCIPDRCFCERIRPGLIRQPVNTWSNLGFILIGLTTMTVAATDWISASRSSKANPTSNLIRTQWVYPVIYGIATISIGWGSMLYHSSLAFFGQTIDVISMYLLISVMLLYNLSRIYQLNSEAPRRGAPGLLKGKALGGGGPQIPRFAIHPHRNAVANHFVVGRFLAFPHKAFVVSYLGMNAALSYIVIRWPSLRRYVFITLLIAVLVTEAIIYRKLRPKVRLAHLWAALICLVLACTAWALDITKVICSPESWLQGHALWHVLTAASIGFVYLYYRSEIPRT